MTTNTSLIHAIADALIETHSRDATEWLEWEGRAKVSAASLAGGPQSTSAPEPTGPRTSSSCRRFGTWSTPWCSRATRASSPAIRTLVVEDRHGRLRGAKTRIREVFVSDVQRRTPATLRAFAMYWSFLR